MGANIKTEGNAAVILGNRRLSGAPVRATDLRAGAALIIAALAAEGESQISGLHHIDRGYEDLVAKFRTGGATVNRTQVTDPLLVG
jgi:UDP-N-acetylglucosamine 1-carboxyvinyltransferase